MSKDFRGAPPTLTETPSIIDARALADILGTLYFEENGDARHIAIDGKKMRASKDGEGNAEHVLSAFCGGLRTVLSNEASRGKGLEIPDALKLLDRLDLKDKIVTGVAIFCQKSITAKIVERGGDYRFAIKDNQRTLRENVEAAFNEPIFFLDQPEVVSPPYCWPRAAFARRVLCIGCCYETESRVI